MIGGFPIGDMDDGAPGGPPGGGGNWWRGGALRKLMWAGAAGLLAMPAIAMALGAPGVNWDETDFIVMGVLLAAACGAVEVMMRMSDDWAYRVGALGAVGTAFFMVWSTGAVGLIAPEGHPADVVILVVLAIGVLGAVAGRFRAGAMGLTLFAMAAAVFVLPMGALLLIPDIGGYDGPLRYPSGLLAISTVFTLGYILAGGLFRLAARRNA